MTKSEQTNHEYYANYETCRNRYFDDFEPDELQNEDIHLNLPRVKKRRKNGEK